MRTWTGLCYAASNAFWTRNLLPQATDEKRERERGGLLAVIRRGGCWIFVVGVRILVVPTGLTNIHLLKSVCLPFESVRTGRAWSIDVSGRIKTKIGTDRNSVLRQSGRSKNGLLTTNPSSACSPTASDFLPFFGVHSFPRDFLFFRSMLQVPRHLITRSH